MPGINVAGRRPQRRIRTRPVNVMLTPALDEALSQEAARRGESRSLVVRQLLSGHLLHGEPDTERVTAA